MFRKIYASQTRGVFLVACLALILGLSVSYALSQQSPGLSQPAALLSPAGSDREQDGLTGPVNSVRMETAKLSVESGRLVEGERELLEFTTYDVRGRRVDSSYYSVSSDAHIGREEYTRDDKGNVSEKTVRDGSNNILSREAYTYEYDAVGNWVKMISSTVTYEGGTVIPQPREATYRRITYYFDQAIAEITRSNSSTATLSPEQRAKGDAIALRGALNEWLAATNARNVDGLMKFYGSRVDAFYRARDVSQAFIRADKTRLFRRVDAIEVRAVSEPEITFSEDERRATMRFRKGYTFQEKGRERRGEVLQQLLWERSTEGWKIVGERDVRVTRKIED
jgi:ketosteroid isomerase-like protein